jgi:GTPase SAR1 family protein
MYKHISTAVDDFLKYTEGRKMGKIKSLKTGWSKLDKVFLDGLDWNRIVTIAGMSGSGKSMMLEQLKKNLIDENPDVPFEVLSFEFEMMPQDQIARSVSGTVGLSTKELYSTPAPLDDATFEDVVQVAAKLRDRPIFYIDEAVNVPQIVEYCTSFAISRKLAENGKGLVITLDHTLLTKGRQNDTEKEILDELAHATISLKRTLKNMNVPNIIVLLAQLNREIEKPDRLLNPMLHYPNKNDIFGASSLYYCSDYVIITHMPAIVLQGITYGPSRPGLPAGLPVYHPDDPKRPLIYWHVVKERFGSNAILSMVNHFERSQITELNWSSQTSLN